MKERDGEKPLSGVYVCRRSGGVGGWVTNAIGKHRNCEWRELMRLDSPLAARQKYDVSMLFPIHHHTSWEVLTRTWGSSVLDGADLPEPHLIL